jgi:chromosome segregation ATPase
MEAFKEELKDAQQSTKRNQEERDGAIHREKELTRSLDEINKRLTAKTGEFDSLQKDYASLQA